MVAEYFDKAIADIANRLSAAGNDTTALAELSAEFQEILTDMFAELPQFVEADDDLDFQGGDIVAPVSNQALQTAIDIHFYLQSASVNYDEFIFTNILSELEQRTAAGDPAAHSALAHYDTLYRQSHSPQPAL
jgi:hypothetical protein